MRRSWSFFASSLINMKRQDQDQRLNPFLNHYIILLMILKLYMLPNTIRTIYISLTKTVLRDTLNDDDKVDL